MQYTFSPESSMIKINFIFRTRFTTLPLTNRSLALRTPLSANQRTILRNKRGSHIANDEPVRQA